jgi:hypothetical protein
MKTKEFLAAIEAYLKGSATSWQIFMVEDHFDSYEYGIDILDLFRDSEVQEIYERMRNKINKRIDGKD